MNEEMKSVLAALEAIEKKMSENVSKEEVKALEEKQEKLSKQILDLQQKGLKLELPQTKQVKTVGELVVEHEAFKNYLNGNATKCRFEIPEFKAEESGSQTPATPTVQNPMLTPTGGVVPAYRRPGILGLPQRQLSIEGLFPSSPISSNSFEYVRETGFLNKAAVVAEGSAKPFSSISFDVKTGKVHTVPHLAKVSKQMLEDAPALIAYLNTRMTYGVDLVVEDLLISGAGGDTTLPGIFTTGNYTDVGASKADLGGSSATLYDLILLAKTKIQKARFHPNLILLNPTDWMKMCVVKNSSGDYYTGGPVNSVVNTLWGLPVLDTEAIPEGKFMVLDTTQAATVWRRSGLVIEMFEQDSDNVQKNLVTIRAERRLGFSIERPEALVGGTLAIPTA
ncbi:phage major capsid protein [Turicimonas muris]|uniref:phage major capsid protein n=3 Tax=Turicimonas muris TaxID=1796652 RepID=UPI001EBB48D6|nr:phage major capsid protein [Turicimonas muris]MBS4847117.1 phage major capsid protein [Burkholderiales bacterium]